MQDIRITFVKVRERFLLYNGTYIITITLLLKLIFIYNHLIKINERRKSVKSKISVFQRSFNQQLRKKRLPAITTSTYNYLSSAINCTPHSCEDKIAFLIICNALGRTKFRLAANTTRLLGQGWVKGIILNSK